MTSNESQTDPVRPHVSRRRMLLGAAGVAGAAVTVGGIGWWARRDADTGHRVWSRTGTGSRVALSATPQPDLYVADFDGTVSALDLRTGTPRWSAKVTSHNPADSNFGWPIAAGDGLVCVTTDSHVHALDAASGAVRWAVPAPGGYLSGWTDGPTVSGDVFVTCDGRVHSYDAATGEARWSSPLEAACVPAVAGGTVYLAAPAGGISALDAKTCERRWEQPAVGKLVDRPVVHEGVLYLSTSAAPAPTGATSTASTASASTASASTASASTVSALDAATGRVLWQRDDLGHPGVQPAPVADGTLCLLDNDRVVAVEASTGRSRWTSSVPDGLGRGMSTMAVADGRVYVALNDGRLHTLDLATGRLQWQDDPAKFGTEYTGLSLTAFGGVAYRGSRAGLYAAGIPAA
ncbi:PQQ-binding-like beta-propeller repeat protein [Kitasatospora sp. NPDC058397]|uniref:outer membrane protein assembly factor BamB family protein n=1 Tax=unclassified Kitasatospora TaxID=2633591 RepID=UPI0036672AC0